MSDLFKTLFEDLPEPDDDLMRLLEAAERVEKMEVHKKPLEDALKELHIEGELFATPDGMKIVFADDAAFHLAAKLLGLPQVITQLAGQGWVPVCGGDVRPGDETSEYTWKFLEVDDVPMSSNDDAPSSEEIATAAMKFNGFAAQDHKPVDPPMQGDARGKVKKSQQNKAVKEDVELNESTLDFIMAYEDGSLDEDEVVAGFQDLIDSGIVWQLQGKYGRMAQSLLDQGLCHPPKDRLRGQPRNKPRPALPGDK